MPEPPKGPPPPGSMQPGPPANKRAQMRDAVQDVMRKVQADREAVKAQEQKSRKKEQRRHTRGIVLVAIGAVLLAAAASWAVPRWQHPFAERTGAAADRDARIAILFTARMVDAWAAGHQRMPRTLQEVGIALPGISYTPGADSYQLSAMVGQQQIRFTSTQDRAAFRNGR